MNIDLKARGVQCGRSFLQSSNKCLLIVIDRSIDERKHSWVVLVSFSLRKVVNILSEKLPSITVFSSPIFSYAACQRSPKLNDGCNTDLAL